MIPLTETNFRTHLAGLLQQAVRTIPGADHAARIEFVRTKQESHGDYSCNLAMQLARSMGKNPREIAASLVAALPASPFLEKVDIAGPGFINLFLKISAKQAFVGLILKSGEAFGHSHAGGGQKIQVEFVSANPTGPLHVGHGRGAALGASLASILSVTGYAVTREYYVNDAGRQMDILTLSVWLRYLERHDVIIPFPGNAYQGDYVRDIAGLAQQVHGEKFVHQAEAVLQDIPDGEPASGGDPEVRLDSLIARARQLLGQDYSTLHALVLEEQLGDCRDDLNEFGVQFDEWFSERSLFDSGKVARAVALLEERNVLYRKDGARWFRSTAFGDEKDRVVQRENGQFTYFASDIAYHLDKFERGFEHIINVWGADHHGYIPRVKGAMQALERDADRLEILLVQFAVLYRDGKKATMSTRSGEFVTLRELRQEVGNDAARFFYVLRKSDQHLDFDLDLAKSQSNDNPVYYIQYAHARVCSVLDQWGEDTATLADTDTSVLDSPAERSLLQKLIDYPDVIDAAAQERAPHLVAFYLKELAGEFHSYYNATRFLVPEIPLRLARLALIMAVRQVLANGLGLLGVSAPEKM